MADHAEIMRAIADKLYTRQDVLHPDCQLITVAVRLNPRNKSAIAGIKIDILTETDMPGRYDERRREPRQPI